MYMKKIRVIKIFDINFLDTDFKNIKTLFQKGILIVFPAAPALINIFNDQQYHKSLKSADFLANVSLNCSTPGIVLSIIILKQAMCIPVGKVSFED